MLRTITITNVNTSQNTVLDVNPYKNNDGTVTLNPVVHLKLNPHSNLKETPNIILNLNLNINQGDHPTPVFDINLNMNLNITQTGETKVTRE